MSLMRKFIVILLMVLMSFGLYSCGAGDKKNPSNGGGTPSNENNGFVIHFDQKDKLENGNYEFNLWLWPRNGDGKDFQFNGEDEFGAYAKYDYEAIDSELYAKELGFIVKENKPWSANPAPQKDVPDDRFINFPEIINDSEGYKHVWIKSKDKNIYTTPDLTMKDVIRYFRFDYSENFDILYLVFETNNAIKSFEITKNSNLLVDSNSAKTDENVSLNISKKFSYSINELPELSDVFEVKVTFKDSNETLTMKADLSGIFTTKAFEKKYAYDGDLGAIYSKMSTEFKVWSPYSTNIKLRIYENGTPVSVDSTRGSDEYQEYEMTKNAKGVWSHKIGGDFAGKYYTYVVNNPKFENKEIVDPYAKSCGVNGLRGMIVDFNTTNPVGWDKVKLHEYKSTNLTVYETHIADLTSSNTWGGTKENSKKFKGFYETGTTYTEGDVTVKTGFDHIKELGVNSVQLLPIFDSANDEVNTEFNWGYNPLNYNSLDGSFASDPYDGNVRIKEFKELVKAYNEAGINIIMDVVYNHVNGLVGSNFDVLMPGYYYRYNDGMPSNGSGCGNETASERYMFRKFMIDSTEFWAKEYKLGGFRFDLMGIHDIDTMNKLSDNLHKTVNEAITVYGEPWAGGTIALSGNHSPADKVHMSQFEGYGCFNDNMRDALIKGGLCDVKDRGWITSTETSSSPAAIVAGIKGATKDNGKLEAEKVVNYATCHDNYTLYDRIKAAGIKDETTIKRMAMLANSVVFTSQGVTFMLAGEEFLRTKNGNSNSYNASYGLNALHYDLKVKNIDMFKNYQKLIALKQNANLFGISNAERENIVVNFSSANDLIYFDLTDKVNKVTYRIAHANGTAKNAKVDFTGYELYLDTLGDESLQLSKDTVLKGYQTIIAKKSI